MEQLLASVTEADLGLFSKNQQRSLLHCFEAILKKAKDRYERGSRLSAEARRIYVFRYPKQAAAKNRRKELEKPREESEGRFAEGIVRVLAQVGDKAALQEIERIIRNHPSIDVDSLTMRRIREHLSFWRERLCRQETANALLRPSLMSDKNMLLHPVESKVTPVQELLRPDRNDRSSHS